MEHLDKVVRHNENPMGNEEEVENDDGGCGVEEISNYELCYMDKLPSEILMKILSFLDEQQLVKRRLVNSRWNQISCLLLQEKAKNNPNSGLIVKIKKYMECATVITKSLDEFITCFSPSEAEIASGRHRPFPFLRFSIQSRKYMDIAQMCEFASTFGPRMKTVGVEIKKDGVANFEGFWRLLLHFAPNIGRLEISGDSSLKDVKLVDPVTKFIAKTDPNVKPPNDTFQNLKVLDIKSERFGELNGFMKDLLDSAPNIQQVSCEHPDFCEALKNLEVWQQLGKGHLLKELVISSYYRSNIAPAVLTKNLRLKNLRANCSGSLYSVKNDRSTINYTNHAIKSSQGTLSTLDLSNLTLESMNLCFKDIASLPNVRQLRFQMNNSADIINILHRFCQLCPNVTSLELDRLRGENFDFVPSLWTGFKRLKSLYMFLTVNNGECHPFMLDFAFTGYSVESIQRIQAKLQEGISLEEARGGETQNPSVLDLKHLAELQLMIDFNDVQWPELEGQVKNSLLIKILPEYLTKNPCLLKFRRTSEAVYDDPFLQCSSDSDSDDDSDF